MAHVIRPKGNFAAADELLQWVDLPFGYCGKLKSGWVKVEWNIIVAKIILTVLCGLMVWMLIVDPQNPLLQSL